MEKRGIKRSGWVLMLVLAAVCEGLTLAAVQAANASVQSAQGATPEVKRWMMRGRELFDFGRWSDARHEFLRARGALDPADCAARQEIDYYLAACAVELGSSDAAGALRDFERNYPASTYANDVRFALGSYYCSQGDYEQADACFRRTDRRALSPSRREQYDMRRGYVLFTQGDYDEAYACFDRIPDNSEYAAHALYHRSYIDYAQGRNGRARQGFEALSASGPYREVAPFYLLQLAFRDGEYRYVIEQAPRLAERAAPERRREIERLLAESWFRQEDYLETIEHLKASLDDQGTTDREGCYLMGFSLYRTTRHAEAAEWLRRACGAPDALTQNASYHLADCYLRMGDKASAMQAFALAADSRYDAAIAEDALFNYAKLQYELGGGAFNGAINLLQRYIEQYPDSPRTAEARTLLIAAYYNSRDYDAAYRAIRAMPSNDPEIRAALQKIAYFRALEAYRSGDTATAAACLRESAAIGVSPKYAALAYFWQGEIAFGRKEYREAASRYEAYLRRAPRNEAEYALAWYNLGYCAFSQQQLPEAERRFERFLVLHPERDNYRGDACNRLGDIRYADRRYAEAITHYDQAAAGSGSVRDYALYRRAVTLGLMGRDDEQQQALERIVAQGTGGYVEAAAYTIGRNHIAREHYAEGVRALEEFVVRYPNSAWRTRALSDLGLACLNLGDHDKSLKYYRQAVETDPRSPEAREAMQGIREIYVSRNEVDAYFDYAARAGMESDLTALSRDSLSFAAAQKLYLAGQHEPAARSLRSYLDSHPKGYYRNDALYLLSDCYLRSGDETKALGTLTELAAAENNAYTLQVLQKVAELNGKQHRYSEAAAAWLRIANLSTQAPDRRTALTEYVRTTLAGGDEEAIRTMADEVRGRTDASAEARRKATFALAELHRRSGAKAAAAELYDELASDEVQTDEGSAAGYYRLEALHEAGNADRTEQAVFAYADRNPKSYWLAKAYLLLGDLYLGKGDTFQARATWQSIVDGYSPADDGIIEEAAARIRKLQ